MSILPTWPIAAAALAVGLVSGFWIEHTRLGAEISQMQAANAEAERQRQLVRADDERLARDDEQRIADLAGVKLKEKEDAKNDAFAQRDAALARLQSRPDRQPARTSTAAPVAPACKGTTGAELSRPDAEFLVREAARADVLRAALGQCYGQYEAAREVINEAGRSDK